MPIYEYLCSQCKTRFEIRLSFREASCTPLCPQCYSEAQRVISSFACKTGGNIQAAEKPFRTTFYSEVRVKNEPQPTPSTPSVLITPPPNRVELLSPPGKRSTRSRRSKK